MVSDTYTVRYLLQATEATPPRVVWHESGGGGLTARVDGVEILLTEIHTRPAIRLGLRFRCREDELWLYSPLPVGWLGHEYATELDRNLADLLHDLFRAAFAQCARKAAYDFEHPEEVRQRIYQQLLFGQPAAAFEHGSRGISEGARDRWQPSA
jgi:hypothetical protein